MNVHRYLRITRRMIYNQYVTSAEFFTYKGVGRKFSREGPTEKRPKISKKGQNSTFKTLFTIFIPCMKIQGGHTPPPPLIPTPMITYCIVSQSKDTFSLQPKVRALCELVLQLYTVDIQKN